MHGLETGIELEEVSQPVALIAAHRPVQPEHEPEASSSTKKKGNKSRKDVEMDILYSERELMRLKQKKVQLEIEKLNLEIEKLRTT